MTKKAMQTVVDCVNVQSDALWEFINDEHTHPEDRQEFLNELNNLCTFMLEAQKKGLNISKSCYPLDKKVARLGGNA